jgi:hypothetical protein
MLGHVAIVVSEKLLDLWEVSDRSQAFVCLNSMDYISK